jgi:hypothetical protein
MHFTGLAAVALQGFFRDGELHISW